VSDKDVVKQNILGHSPELDSDTSNLGKVGRSRIFIILRVGDPRGLPQTLVSGIGDLGNRPFSLSVSATYSLRSAEEMS
jgi:hypothetical protein